MRQLFYRSMAKIRSRVVAHFQNMILYKVSFFHFFEKINLILGDILRAIEAPPRQATPPPTPSTLDDILSKFELTKVNDQTYHYR